MVPIKGVKHISSCCSSISSRSISRKSNSRPNSSKTNKPNENKKKQKTRLRKKAAYSLVSGALAVWDRNQTFLQFTAYHL